MNTTITKVTRNRITPDRAVKPWLVFCAACSGNDIIFGAFLPKLLGFALTWRAAYDAAREHALAHEARRCTTCLHLPTGPLPTEANR